MKPLKLILAVAAVVAALFACTLENPWSTGTPDSPAALPPDTANDTLRSTDGPFAFETLLPVALDLQVKLYEGSPTARGLESLSAEERLVIATLTDSAGNLVFRGRFGRDGRLRALVALAAVPEDMSLFLEAPGFEKRSVRIPAMARYSEVRRIMGLLSDGTAGEVALPDSDGDGVPDMYDQKPHDPKVTFVNTVPAEGSLTVAFEDQYKVERAGDADYNDFVAEYRVIQSWLGDRVSMIEIEALAKRKWAGYNHAFGMTLEFDGAAEVTIERFRSSDAASPFSVKSFSIADGPGIERAVLELFRSTRDSVQPDGSMGHRSVCTIRFAEPYADPATLSNPPYDPYLYIWNTGYDVHLIGRKSLPRVPDLYWVQRNTPEDAFQDAEGYPWALLVPTSWESPAEAQYIGEAYPLFDRWRESFGREVPDWYLYPAGSSPPPDDNAPPVAEFPEEPFSGDPWIGGTLSITYLYSDADGDLEDSAETSIRWYRLSSPDETIGKVAASNTLSYPPGKEDLGMWLRVEVTPVDARGAVGEPALSPPIQVTRRLYPRIVIDTYSANGSMIADTFVDLFGGAGDTDTEEPWNQVNGSSGAIASADGGNPDFTFMARIDYTGGLPAGTYYIRVRGSTALVDDFYAIRVLAPAAGADLPDYQFPGLDSKPDSYEPDDEPRSEGVPANPVPILLGNDNALSRSLHYDFEESRGDIDWFVLELP